MEGSWRWTECTGTNLLDDPTVRAIVCNYRDISERKWADQALRESEATLARAQQIAHLGSWEWDTRTNAVRCSDEIYRILGLTPSPSAPTYEALLQIVHPDDRARLLRAVFAALNQGKPFSVDHRILLPSGEIRTVNEQAEVVYDESGKALRFLGTVLDITERNRAEQALQETSQMVQALITASPLAIVALDAHDNIQTWSSAAERIFGWTAEEVLGRPSPTFPEEMRQEYLEILQRYRQGAVVAGYETQRLRKDGSLIEVGIWAAPLGSSHGGGGTIAIVADITERKRAEKALQESENRLRAILNQTPTIVHLKDIEGRYLSVNRQWENLFHLTRNEVVGKTPHDFFPKETADQLLANDRVVLKSGKPLEFEEVVPQADGMRTYLAAKFPLFDSAGAAYAVCGIATDITERQRTQGRIQRHHRQLTALHAITAGVSRSLELPEVLATAKRLVCEELGVPGGLIYFLQVSTGQLVFLDGWGVPETILEQLARSPPDGSLTERVMQEMAAVLIPDFRQVPMFAKIGLDVERPEWQSYLCVPLLMHGQLLGMIGLFSPVLAGFDDDEVILHDAAAQAVGAALQNAQLYEEVRDARERLHKLSLQLVELQETERQSIARELHDEIGQLLTGLKLTLGIKEASSSEAREERLSRARGLVNELIGRARELSCSLRSTVLDDLGLLPALLWHFVRYTEQTGIRVEIAQGGLEGRFPRAVETTAYRIVQEGLTNVARHAGVEEVAVRLWVRGETLGVQIADQGRGFDVAALTAGDSNGLLRISERAKLLGGRLEVDSAPEAGTRLTAELPLGEPARSTEPGRHQ